MRSPKNLRALFHGIATATLACGGVAIDRAGYDLDVCTGPMYLAAHGLTESPQVDYVELRREQQQYGTVDAGPDAMLAYLSVTDKDGTLCATASEAGACQSAFTNLRTQAGWMNGEGNQVREFEYLAWTRGDAIGTVTNAADLGTFLAPIDTVKDAALIAYANGHRLVCDGRKNAKKTANGWELITQTGIACGANTGVDEHVVAVSTSGAFSVLSTVRIRNGDPNCAIGRRPEGLMHARPSAGGVGGFFAAAARLEAASVVAFERLADELRAHGAPDDLVQDARRAAHDEVRHARATRAMAERFGERCEPPRVEDRPIRDRLAIALENAVEGCVRETFGALVATYQSSRAADPQIASLMEAIAEDETRHAELAWRIALWIDQTLSEEERTRVHAAQQAAAAELRADLHVAHDAEVRDRAGMPDVTDALRMWSGAAQELWA
jgi:hypothetical protein